MKVFSYLPKTFPNFPMATYASMLDASLHDCESVLDVGCGGNSPLRLISKKVFSVGVDGYKPSIQKSKKSKIHDKYEQLDIRQLLKKFGKKSFDAVIALDVIEHLKKNEGIKLLKDMEAIARKKVIILTPNGFVEQFNLTNNLHEHLSGWIVNDFGSRGYTVSGLYGLKFFRRNHGDLQYKPKIISGALSELSHYFYTRRNPASSFSLFAVKSL